MGTGTRTTRALARLPVARSLISTPSSAPSSASRLVGTDCPFSTTPSTYEKSKEPAENAPSEETRVASRGALVSHRSAFHRIQAVEDFNESFCSARRSKDPRIKSRLVSLEVPKLLRAFGKTTNTALLGDLFSTLAYVALPKGTGFDMRVGADPLNLFPGLGGKRVQFQVHSDFRMKWGLKELAEMPVDAMPSAGAIRWDVRSAQGKSIIIAIPGTNSVGRERDATFGDEISTGALANAHPKGVGYGSVELMLDRCRQLREACEGDVILTTGHSQGGAVAQELTMHLLEILDPQRAKRLRGSFHSAPCLSRPQSERWRQHWDQMFNYASAQDPVPRSGTFKYAGKEIVVGVGDAPINRGRGNSLVDGVLTQHGMYVPTLLLARDGELKYRDREATNLGEPGDGMFPVDQLLYEALDLARPSVAMRAFTPTSLEKIVHDMRKHGLAADLSNVANPNVHGPRFAYVAHLIHRLGESDLLKRAVAQDVGKAQRAVAAAAEEMLKSPDRGIEALARGLLELAPGPSDLARFKDVVMKLNEEMKKLR